MNHQLERILTYFLADEKITASQKAFQSVTPANPPKADKSRGPEILDPPRRTGFRLSPEWQKSAFL